MKNYLLLAIIILLGVTSCQPGIQFKNHPQPNLTVDFSAFEEAGCPPNQYGDRNCNQDSPLAALGCDQIEKPSNLLGGLDPSYPLALCIVDPWDGEPGESFSEIYDAKDYFFMHGGPTSFEIVRYVILRNSQFQLVKNEKELRDIFAPIDSADEALSYALAVGSGRADYDLKYDPKYTYLVGTIEDTHVDTLADGYEVTLYSATDVCVRPYSVLAHNTHVSPQGVVEEASSTEVYKDPVGRCGE